MTICDSSVAVGPYLLSALSPSERQTFEAHVGQCASCRDEIDSLASVTRAMRAAGPMRFDATDAGDGPAAGVEHSVVAVVTADLLRERRRNRVRRLVAAALFVAVGLSGAFIASHTGNDGERSRAAVAVQRFEFQTPDGVEAYVELSNYPTGAYAKVSASGLPKGQVYRMWFEAPDGGRLPFGSFRATGAPWDNCWGGVGVDLAELTAVGASDEQGRDVLRADFAAMPTKG